MTSYWKRLVNINSSNDKTKTKKNKSHQSNHRYHQVSTTSPNIKHNIIKSKPKSPKNTNQSPKNTNQSINTFLSRTSNNINIKLSDDSESELDDGDFPDATQEQTSLINEQPIHRSANTRHPWSNRELSWWNHFSIGAYWFGWAFLWMPMLVIIIPHQIDYILGENDRISQGKSMGTVFLFGSIGSLICSPVFGHLSDCSQNAMGRRRPFLMVGICVTTMGLLLMSISPPYNIYCIGFFICSCGNFITLAPYSALVPDVVPYDQRGICSGWLGACSMFGYLLGGAMSYHLEKLGFFLTFIVLAMVHAFFGWITIRFVPEIHIEKTIYKTIENDDSIDNNNNNNNNNN
eukprot:928587_1